MQDYSYSPHPPQPARGEDWVAGQTDKGLGEAGHLEWDIF